MNNVSLYFVKYTPTENSVSNKVEEVTECVSYVIKELLFMLSYSYKSEIVHVNNVKQNEICQLNYSINS
jgi:hypothetical protein